MNTIGNDTLLVQQQKAFRDDFRKEIRQLASQFVLSFMAQYCPSNIAQIPEQHTHFDRSPMSK